MLRGAYSHLNSFGKFILLITLVLSFLLFSTLLGILVLVPFFGMDVVGMLSAPDYSSVIVVNALKVLQIINMAGGLLLPALIYLWLCRPADGKPGGMFDFPSVLTMLLSFLLMVLAQPLIAWASELNSYLSLPEGLSAIEKWMKDAETQGGLITEAFLSTTSIGGLLINVFMIAILPAFAEEILFRGAMANLFKTWSKNIHFAVFLSSFIFAAIHLQFYGFLPRFLLGTALGYLYFWSGSLWLPITAHFANNFLSVIVQYLFNRGLISTNAESFGMDIAGWVTGLSAVAVTGVLFYIFKLSAQRKVEGEGTL